MRLLGLAANEKSRARQRSRVTWLGLGDANTKLFHLLVNARKKKFFIHSLQSEGQMLISQAAKQKDVVNHFLQHSGTYVPRLCSLDFLELGWQPRNLDHLELPFTQQVIQEVIMSAPREKAQGQMALYASSSQTVGTF
jgi:hypothetical protein